MSGVANLLVLRNQLKAIQVLIPAEFHGVELALQALPGLRQLAALHQARERGIAVVAVAVLSRVPQPDDQQQAPAFRFKGTEEQAVAIPGRPRDQQRSAP